MKYTMTAGVSTYSIVSVSPQMKPPVGPNAFRVNEKNPPAWGSAAESSAIVKTMYTYMTAITTVPTASPPNPPCFKPAFQPAKSPEMTAPTPSAHSNIQSALLRSLRLSRYSRSTSS